MNRLFPLSPAVPFLIGLQARARIRRLLAGFSTPRRMLLTSLGLLLGCVYLGQAAVSMWWREPLPPGRLRAIVPLALLAYICWDILQVAWRRPKQGIRLRPEERQQLGIAPLSRRDLIGYRLLGIAAASLLKGAFFCMVMIADLPCWPISFLGVACALALIDQMRLLVAVWSTGLDNRMYRLFRWGAFSIAGSAALSALTIAFSSPQLLPSNSFAASMGLVMRGGRAFAALGETWVGQVGQAIFVPYANLIAVDTWDVRLLGWLGLALAVNGAIIQGLVRLDEHVHRRNRWRERQQLRRLVASAPDGGDLGVASPAWIRLPGRAAWTAVAWRQLQSARRYWPNLTIALAAPGALSLLPLLLGQRPTETFFAVVGSLAFYTFVLLPAALKFDFRRDVDRIVAIKMLPLPATHIVGGQLLAPWLVTSVFQFAVLWLALLATGVSLGHLAAAMAILWPLSLICFGLDNLIFLMYPHRLREEGLVMFVRTTLTFTAKGLFFGVGLLLVAAWAFVARLIASTCGAAPAAVFLGGLACLLVAVNFVILRLIVAAFQHFDVSWDRP